jgi:hypothetical protein
VTREKGEGRREKVEGRKSREQRTENKEQRTKKDRLPGDRFLICREQ